MRWSRYGPSRHRITPEQLGYAEPLEKHIAADAIRALRTIGADVSSTQQTRASRQTIGMPDLWVTHAAWRVFAWLEVKRPGEKATRAQLEWHERCRAAGVPVLVVTSPEEAVREFCALRRRVA